MHKEYRLLLTNRFQRDLERLSANTQDKVLLCLKQLREDPYGSALDIKKLSGVKIGLWRLRIGDYRVRYDIEGEDIIPHGVRHRKETYRIKG